MQENMDKIKFWKPIQKNDIILYEANFSNFNLDKHIHEEYTISLIEKGKMNAFVKGFHHKLDKTSIITINPDEVHACAMLDNKEYRHKSIYLKPTLVKEILKTNFNKELLLFKDFQFHNNELASKLLFLMNEKCMKYINILDWECETLDVINKILLNTTKSTIQKDIATSNPLIYLAKEYINDNFHQNFSLDDIAKELNISKYHFLRLFKEQTHLSPHTYLMARRVEKAKDYLRKGETLISTAYKCGFNDQSHLNRKFKALTGITPGTYQKFLF